MSTAWAVCVKRMPSPTWAGSVQSVEGLSRKKQVKERRICFLFELDIDLLLPSVVSLLLFGLGLEVTTSSLLIPRLLDPD